MDPVLKLYLYEHWLGDHRDDAELAKNHAYLIASFTNPEAVQKLLSDDTHESTEEDFEESLKMVRDASLKFNYDQDKGKRKRRRKADLKTQ